MDEAVHDWGRGYDWVETLEAAQDKSIEEWKPVMVIIYHSWCGHSKNLRKKFAKDEGILEMSGDFVMVKLGDDKVRIQ